MINEQEVRKIYFPCGFVHREIEAKQRKISKPNDETLSKVISTIRIHKKITRKNLILKSGVSPSAVDSCTNYLMHKKTVKRVFIKKYGMHAIYDYSINDQQKGITND